MTLRRQHLRGDGGDRRAARSRRHRADGGVLAGMRARGGRLFFLGVGGSAANCFARGQRLPQARRLRGLCAHRQRLRAHRAHERRRLGDVFVEWLKGSRLRRRGRGVRPVGRRRRSRAEHQPAIWCARSNTPTGRAPRSSASSAATAATPRRSPTPCVVVPTVNPRARDAAHGGVSGGGLASARLASGAARRRRRSGSRGPADGRRAVFLDRDGVLNRAYVRDGMPHPPASARCARDPARACRRRSRGCARAGFRLIVVTNQPDVARGTQTPGGRRGDARAALAARCRSTKSASATMTTPTAASAASRSPGCSDRGRRAADLRRELHGRRSLARHRSRPARRLHDVLIDRRLR